MRILKALPLSICFLFFYTANLHSAQPASIILSDEEDRYSVGLHLEILEDPGGDLTFEDVRSELYNGRFTPSTEEIPNLGISNSTFWVRFQVKNEATSRAEWLLEAADTNINEITFYIPDADGNSYHIIETGRAYPPSSRPINHRNFVVPFTLEPQAQKEIYVQATSLPLSLPLTIWSPNSFWQVVQQDYLLKGIILGSLLIMAGYNFFLYFSLRDKSYLYYVLFILCMFSVKFVRDGFATQYLQTEGKILNVRIELLLFSLIFIFLLGLTKSFLLTAKYTPRLNIFINYVRLGVIITTLLLVLFPGSLIFIPFYFIAVLFSIGVVLVSGIIVWQKGYRAARLFMLTWFGFLLQIGIALGAQAGYFSFGWYVNRIELTSVWVVLMLALALADRIKILTYEKENVQAKLLQQQQEMLRLNDAYTVTLQQANEQLQQTVLEKERAQQHLRTYAQELEQNNRDLQNFAYVASHDLQEPLRKIQTLGDRLSMKHGQQLNHQGQDYLRRMQNAAARMQILIEDLLSFSKAATKSGPYERLQLTAVLEEVQQNLAQQIKMSSAQIKIRNLPEIEADHTQMVQLFHHLITNALKFRHDNVAPIIVIEGEQQPEQNSCQILVQDNGIGFNQEYQERIFFIFKQLHGQQDYTGTGIGLSLCKKIVERHKGTITAHSEEGEGATFVINLPLSQA